jgi:transposase
MKRSRKLYVHEEVNEGKISSLDDLHVEYRRYLQACIDAMLAAHRTIISRKDLLDFFPPESVLSTNIVAACQQHAVAIVSGWAISRYTNHVKKAIQRFAREDVIDEPTKIQLFTIGKYNLDKPTKTISQEALDLYWTLLLDAGKAPTVSSRVGIRTSIHTSDLRLNEDTSLTPWWLGFSGLAKGKRTWLPLKANPFVKSPKDVTKGCLLKRDRKGRWRVEVVETKEYEVPDPLPDAPRLGMDVGLNVIAATSDGRLFGEAVKSKFDVLYGKMRSTRANRQRQGLKENSARLDSLEDRLSGFIKTVTGTIANDLIKSHPAHVFVLEDLDLRGCRGQKRFAYRALHRALSMRTLTIAINAAYTSQMCPSCGYVSRGNRTGVRFICRSCGRKSHADVVGGINVLGRSEDTHVGLDDHPSEVKALLRERYRARRRDSSSREPEVTALLACSRRLTTRGSPSGDTRTALNAYGISRAVPPLGGHP